MSLKCFEVNDVEAGREYIEAYVSFLNLQKVKTTTYSWSPPSSIVICLGKQSFL
jgi:hypothetical protein